MRLISFYVKEQQFLYGITEINSISLRFQVDLLMVICSLLYKCSMQNERN